MVGKKAQVLVVAPHPDDPEFGIAGTVARWTREGRDVVYLICTNGDKGSSDLNMKPEALACLREAEQLAAAKVLKVREVIFLRHHDQALEDTPDFRKEIVRFIRIFQPDTVATTDPYRHYIWHRDHRITGQVTLDAIFPYARDFLAYPDLMSEGIGPHKVKELLLWGSENPNFYSDITDTFNIKITALSCHRSQVGDNSLAGLEQRLRERHKQMAKDQGYELAEAFHRVEIPF